MENTIKVSSPTKRTKRGQYLYDLVSKHEHKETLNKVKEFLNKYYQELTFNQIVTTVKALYNVNLTQGEIKNLCLSINLLPKNISASTRKFEKKEFDKRVARGLWLEYFNYWEVKPIKLKPE